MKLIGFNLNKINIEKLKDSMEDLKINTNINLSEIKPVKADFFKSKEELIGVTFVYTLNYEPDLAKIEFKGNLVLAIDSKLNKEVLKQWEDKKIPEDFRITIFNLILRKTSVRALQLEEEMNLPLHLALPSIKKQEKTEAKED